MNISKIYLLVLCFSFFSTQTNALSLNDIKRSLVKTVSAVKTAINQCATIVTSAVSGWWAYFFGTNNNNQDGDPSDPDGNGSGPNSPGAAPPVHTVPEQPEPEDTRVRFNAIDWGDDSDSDFSEQEEQEEETIEVVIEDEEAVETEEDNLQTNINVELEVTGQATDLTAYENEQSKPMISELKEETTCACIPSSSGTNKEAKRRAREDFFAFSKHLRGLNKKKIIIGRDNIEQGCDPQEKGKERAGSIVKNDRVERPYRVHWRCSELPEAAAVMKRKKEQLKVILQAVEGTKQAKKEEKKKRKVLRKALKQAISQNNINILEELREKGVNILQIIDSSKNTTLHFAALKKRSIVAKFLINQGALINKRNEHGETPLMLAASKGDIETMKLLIDSGAHIAIIDKSDYSALTNAIERKKLMAIEFLINKGAKLSELDIEEARENGIVEVLETCLEERNLAQSGKKIVNADDAVQNVFAGGDVALKSLSNVTLQEVNKQHKLNGETTLHRLVRGKYKSNESVYFPCNRLNKTQRIRLALLPKLISNGAKLTLQDGKWGDMPLHAAVRAGNIAGVEQLLLAGAPVNAANRYGDTPLHILIETSKFNGVITPTIASKEIAEWLMYCGASPDIKNKERNCVTPRQMFLHAKNQPAVEVIKRYEKIQNWYHQQENGESTNLVNSLVPSVVRNYVYKLFFRNEDSPVEFKFNEEVKNELIEAVLEGNTQEYFRLIQKGANPDTQILITLGKGSFRQMIVTAAQLIAMKKEAALPHSCCQGASSNGKNGLFSRHNENELVGEVPS